MTLAHTHSNGAPCLACDLQIVESWCLDEFGFDRNPQVRTALARIEAALSEREHLRHRLDELIDDPEGKLNEILKEPPRVIPALVELLRKKRSTEPPQPLDHEMLNACADMIRQLDEHGPSESRRKRVKLLADWERTRKTNT